MIATRCIGIAVATTLVAGCFVGPPTDSVGDAAAGVDGGAAIDGANADASCGDARSPDGASDAGDSAIVVHSDAAADTEAIDAANAPTWTFVYDAYFQAGATVGHCGNSACHDTLNRGIQCDTVLDCYDTLQTVGYINGTSSPIVSRGQSMLSWYGGSMPQDTQPMSAPDAQRDIEAWVAAGALRN
jgi:hypothetical protein